jgi:hypothetical protein
VRRTVLTTVTFVAGSFLLAVPAQAGGPVDAVRTRVAASAIRTVPCQPGGVSAADKAIAKALRPAMNGRRLGHAVTGYNISCARAIVDTVRARGLGQRAAMIAVTTAIAESTLHNYVVAVDHDSLGLFQQRPSTGWGRPEQIVDPGYATGKFLDAMIRKFPSDGWLTAEVGQICQRVQGSAFPAAYAPEAHDAQLVVNQLWGQKATPDVTPTQPNAAPPVPKNATGPFQRSLLVTGTGQGPADARHDVSTADWNGDRRPDLVVVQRSGTRSGRTELYILDGMTNFKRLLLHTGTALAPTDDRHAFALADWNGDARLDLVVTQRSGTASGRTELRVVDGASGFQRYLLETHTVLGLTDHRYAFSVADWNADGRLDLVAVQKSGTQSRRTEVRVVDGASGFQRYLVETGTKLGPTDHRYAFSVADWNADGRLDLVAVQKSGTASRQTEVRVLDGASNFRRYLLQARTALGPTDDRYDVSTANWNGDQRPDLVVVQKSGTASGQAEARILAG